MLNGFVHALAFQELEHPGDRAIYPHHIKRCLPTDFRVGSKVSSSSLTNLNILLVPLLLFSIVDKNDHDTVETLRHESSKLDCIRDLEWLLAQKHPSTQHGPGDDELIQLVQYQTVHNQPL